MSTISAIALLWLAMIVGMTAHMAAGLLPLFAGVSVREPEMSAQSVNRNKWLYVLVTIIPMLLIAGLFIIEDHIFRWLNLSLAVALTLMHVQHLTQHLLKSPSDHAQNALLSVVMVLSSELTYFSYLWAIET